LRILFFLLHIAIIFVPEKKYTKKVKKVNQKPVTYQGKLDGKWEHHHLRSKVGIEHNYISHPSAKENSPVLVMIHGMTIDSRIYMNLAPLSSNYTLVAYNFPSRSPLYDGTLTAFTGMVYDFIKAKHFKKPVIMGTSFGAVVAVNLTANFNDRVNAPAVILTGTGITGNNERVRENNIKTAEWLKELPDYKVYWLMEKLVKNSDNLEKPDKNESHAYLGDVFEMKSVQYYRQVVYATQRYNSVTDLSNITIPVLVFQGEEDGLFEKKQTYAMTNYLKNVDIKFIKNGSHSVVYAQGKKVSAIISDFCSKESRFRK